jgi:hypothetical protein
MITYRYQQAVASLECASFDATATMMLRDFAVAATNRVR